MYTIIIYYKNPLSLSLSLEKTWHMLNLKIHEAYLYIPHVSRRIALARNALALACRNVERIRVLRNYESGRIVQGDRFIANVHTLTVG